VGLLFQAHAEAELFEHWMSHDYGATRVLKLDNRQHGGFRFQTSDAEGNVLFAANGTIHEFVPDEKITRTFEMENTPFDVQLEFLEFERIDADTSKLNMHVVYRSVELRDQMLKLPFAAGLNMAHNRLQETLSKLK
jgi:uncharacterized protein YndB with AHSA1/START domain